MRLRGKGLKLTDPNIQRKSFLTRCVNSLCELVVWNRCEIVVKSLWNRCEIVMKSLWTRCELVVTSLRTRCEIVVNSLWVFFIVFPRLLVFILVSPFKAKTQMSFTSHHTCCCSCWNFFHTLIFHFERIEVSIFTDLHSFVFVFAPIFAPIFADFHIYIFLHISNLHICFATYWQHICIYATYFLSDDSWNKGVPGFLKQCARIAIFILTDGQILEWITILRDS